MIWAATSWFSSGPIITQKGKITGQEYSEILDHQVHFMIQILFPAEDGIFQDDNAPVHAAELAPSGFDNHEDKVQHIPTVTRSQSRIHDEIRLGIEACKLGTMLETFRSILAATLHLNSSNSWEAQLAVPNDPR
ncbi:DDE_3 domain-containing protein [Trichonephila clavipes]|nr:DDE_3 domain-containing protein [Trichonephila clavipes]